MMMVRIQAFSGIVGILLRQSIPPTNMETMVEGLKIASDYALSLGCTGIHDAGLTNRDINAYQQAEKEGKLKVRSYIMVRGDAEDAAIKLGVQTGLGDDMVQLGPVKLLMDGSLGARTAALFEPYEDEPSTSGLLLIKPEVLTEKIIHAHEANLQTATHAIGDLAVEKVLDSIQEALRRKPKKNHRHRIEHCETNQRAADRANQTAGDHTGYAAKLHRRMERTRKHVPTRGWAREERG